MRERSKIKERIVAFINSNPKHDGYVPQFFVGAFTSDAPYCRQLLLALAEEGRIIKRTFKAANNKQGYKFFATSQGKNSYGVMGMDNFISPSIFSNNNVDPDFDSIINSKEWAKFVTGTRIHYLMGEASKKATINILKKVAK